MSSQCRLYARQGEFLMLKTETQSLRLANALRQMVAATVKNSANTSPSSSSSSEKTLPTDKPLPNPPVVQVNSYNPLDMSRNILDATEKPLRRSPPGKAAKGEEEWPVLFPEKRITSTTSQVLAKKPNTEGNPDRFPRLPSTAPREQKLAEDGTMGTRSIAKPADPSNQKIHRKPVHVQTPRKLDSSDISSDMSASAAALEKAEKPLDFSQPRQTRTSSLRARISAGALSTEGTGGNKVVGFTDFINEDPETTAAAGKSLAKAHRPTSSARGRRPASGTGGQVHGRHPAKMVAGIRRPEIHRSSSRASSRNSHSSESITKRERPSKGFNGNTPQEQKEKSGLGGPRVSEQITVRNSSIPVLRQVVSSGQVAAKVDGKLSLPQETEHKTSGQHAFDIFEDSLPSDTSTVITSPNDASKLDITPASQKVHDPLEEPHGSSIVSSGDLRLGPGDRMKRLSRISPEHGPVLKISASAERLIMGDPTLDKENTPLANGNKSKDLHRTVVTNELRKASKEVESRSLLKKMSRPRSTGSQYEFNLRGGHEKVARSKKAMSADVNMLLSIDIDKDPFVDSQPLLPKYFSSQGLARSTQDTDNAVDLASHSQSYPIELPSSNDVAFESMAATSKAPLDSKEAVEMPLKPSIPEVRPKEQICTNVDAPKTPSATAPTDVQKDKAEQACSLPLLETPLENLSSPKSDFNAKGRKSSGGLPPRSSSKAIVPDYTSPRSTPAKANRAAIAPHLSRDFSAIQNKLGSSNGLGSAQVSLDLERTRTGFENAKRDSQSSKRSSQRSASKTMLSMSNLRGLFRKTPSEQKSEGASLKTNKQRGSNSAVGGPSTPPVEAGRAGVKNKGKSWPRGGKSASFGRRAGFNSPGIGSPSPSEVAQTTSLAMDILNSAREEEHSPTKERLLEMGKVMVDAITHARDAEKAMEQAKMAADKAEMAYMLTKQSVLDVGSLIQEWREVGGRK